MNNHNVKVEPHEWWDRRMDVRNNLRYNLYLPLLCRIHGHEFNEWFDNPNGTESAWCDRCQREAVRSQRSSGQAEARREA